MQHIDNITAWTTYMNQSQKHCLLQIQSSARVKKSAIAKSYAEKTKAQCRLGTFFFSSHTYHIDDYLQFFTTITHQLSMKINEYRKILNIRIQHNPTLLTKEIDIQFCELIIELFLEFVEQSMGMQNKIVIIDSLDKYNKVSVQHKIMEFVAKLVIENNDKTPLLQAFFS